MTDNFCTVIACGSAADLADMVSEDGEFPEPEGVWRTGGTTPGPHAPQTELVLLEESAEVGDRVRYVEIVQRPLALLF